jgi:hypothetical protein
LLLAAALVLGGGVARGGPPLAAELYQIFGLHVGDHAYLNDYAALVNSVPRDARRSGATLLKFFKTKARPMLKRLVAAINSGADPTALRDRILTSLKLGQRYGRLNGKPWPYGPMYLRLAVGSAMYREAVAFDRAHHPRAARRWLRAAAILNAQDDVLTGPLMVLSPLVSPKAWPYWQRLVKSAPAQAAGDVKGYRQNVRILDLSPGQRAALRALYRRRIRSLSGPVMKAANTFADPEAVLKASPAQRGAMLQRLLKSLSLFARSHAPIGARYELLDNAAWVRSQLERGGLAGASQSILRELRGWELRVRHWHSGSIRPLYRKALLRWIKEAMGP